MRGDRSRLHSQEWGFRTLSRGVLPIFSIEHRTEKREDVAMLGILIGALLLGVIISVMEGDFPDFLALVGCVVIAAIGQFAGVCGGMSATGNPLLGILAGCVLGGILGGVAIAKFIGMTVQRACIAAGIYTLVNVALSFGIQMLFA